MNSYDHNSPFLIDLNEDQTHNDPIFSDFKSQASSSSSFDLSTPNFFNPPQDHHGGYYVQQSQPQEEAKEMVVEGRSCESQRSTLKFTIWKKKEEEDHDEDKKEIINNQSQDHHLGSVKWMSSKMRMMKKMMKRSDHGEFSTNPMKKYEDQKPSSPPETDHSSSSSHNNTNITIRVCADCNTTKTPLWRSGPRGPKSLCNACGIRQRKARRAMAAAAAAASTNGAVVAAAEASKPAKGKIVQQNKDKRSSNGFKKKHKITPSPIHQERNKLCFEDLNLILSQQYSSFHGVFPQDEKEAAILLMALSYGLVHG